MEEAGEGVKGDMELVISISSKKWFTSSSTVGTMIIGILLEMWDRLFLSSLLVSVFSLL